MRSSLKFFMVIIVVLCTFLVTGCLFHKMPESTSNVAVQPLESVENTASVPVENDSSDSQGENGAASEESSVVTTRFLLDEARDLVCTGAKLYVEGDKTSALDNMDAAMLNMQMADLPVDMQVIGFFQPYLPSDCKMVDVEKVYKELKETYRGEDIGQVDLDQFQAPQSLAGERSFIEMEIRRIMENLGENPPKPEDMKIFVDEVEYFMQYFRTNRRDWFERSYQRMLKYRNTVEKIFAEKRLPSELAYLAFVESGYLYRATSRSKARGIWQFMSRTGRSYGLKIGRHIDDRLDPVKSTEAAREYLLDLISIFGSRSFLLAMASYNAGEGRVQRCLRQLDDPFENRSFWKIRDSLKKETQEYIPRIIAAAILCENHQRFGFDLSYLDDMVDQYDLIIIPKRVKLSAVCKASGITVKELRKLNPDLPSGGSWTPVNNTHLWIPKGTLETVTAAIQKMKSAPEQVSENGDYHIVRSGDNLYKIGRRYKIPYKKLADWNNISYPYSIKPKQKIYLQPPGAISTHAASSSSKKKCDETLVYIVQKGNYLAGIGSLFGASARNIMAINNLARGTIFPGQRLLICPGFTVEIIQHKVVKNETLSSIGSKYGVSVDQLEFVNGIRQDTTLQVGQKLIIYRKAS